ncbi:osmotically inducible protein OsmC [Mucilaginibacter pineti]|uniref:Osmotically inducible protein OsmC n=1 Tax=Mucilaginibacter pineti TaxID=1391627 RepID=A0A1G6Z766_9SPHI|nr:OsmC family peroxiredoxin [Mucilaginibacter pineti]SDD98371.1 osmotically inducible protein OsmC [Mucilaginibacter pineti]
MKQCAKAIWNGNGLEGNGRLSVQSQSVQQTPYSFNSRFNAAKGTNPEELLAAAHASDFTMKLSFILTEAGYPSRELTTTCSILFEKGQIVSSTLNLTANIPGIEQAIFNTCVNEANEFCPISRILNIEVFIHATLQALKQHHKKAVIF